jgi:hypothetical protein
MLLRFRSLMCTMCRLILMRSILSTGRCRWRFQLTSASLDFHLALPLKGTAIWVRGTIASEPGIDYDDLPRFLVDARTRVGQSGSPVIRVSVDGLTPTVDWGVAIYNGPVMRLVGVYSGRINQESDLGYVWRVGVINDILTGSKRAGGPV